jgi:hypothetical protein
MADVIEYMYIDQKQSQILTGDSMLVGLTIQEELDDREQGKNFLETGLTNILLGYCIFCLFLAMSMGCSSGCNCCCSLLL